MTGGLRSASDPVLMGMGDADACARLKVTLRPEFGPGGLAAEFDIVLG